jgi:ACS family D-galactonate transporter-like MFS transporter
MSAYFMSGAIGFLGVGIASYWTVMQGLVPTQSVGAAAGVMNGAASLGSAMMPLIVGHLIGSSGDYVSGLMFLVVMGLAGAVCAGVLSLRGD